MRDEPFVTSMFRAPQWHGAAQTHSPPPRQRKPAWHCDITNVISPHRLSRANTSESSSATLFPALHLYYKLATSEFSSRKLFPARHLYYKLATSESSSEKLFPIFPVLHLYNWPLLSPAPKRSFPYYICTTNWPLLSPAPKSSFPHYTCTTYKLATSESNYICTTNWPGPLLSPAPRFTNYCACHEICTSRFTIYYISAAPATKSALRGSQCAVPATKSALRGSPSAVPATKSALRRSQSTAAPATKSAL